jgi:hypothetical protein
MGMHVSCGRPTLAVMHRACQGLGSKSGATFEY